MVRTLTDRKYDKELHYYELVGKSTDTKPIGKMVSGSKFTEIDTGTIYLYDEDGAAGERWVPFAQFTVDDQT